MSRRHRIRTVLAATALLAIAGLVPGTAGAATQAAKHHKTHKTHKTHKHHATPKQPPRFYVSQNGGGSRNGSSCADARAVSWFNSGGDWGAGRNQLGPGKTVHLCGTISSPLVVNGSGRPGRPITISFERGASLSEPYCPGQHTGCLNTAGHTDLTIDGGVNGSIVSTSNGTDRPNHADDVVGISALNCSGCTIEHLNISDMYVHVYSAGQQNDCAASVNTGIIASGSDLTIAHNTMHDDRDALDDDMNTSDRNIHIYGNNIFHDDGGILLAPVASGHLGSVYIHDNHMSNWSNWDTKQDCFHHDGIHCFTGNDAGPSHWAGIYIYDNVFDGETDTGRYGDADNMTAEVFIQGAGSTECADGSSPIYVFDNVLQTTYYLNNGMITMGSGSGYIYDNTIVGGTNRQGAGFAYGSNGQSGAFYNNVISNVHEAMYTQGASLANFAGGIGNNVYADGGRDPFVCPNASFVGLGGWLGCVRDKDSKVRSSAALNSNGSPKSHSPLLNAGRNLTSMCRGALRALCRGINGVPRPRSGKWDAGAYQLPAHRRHR
jgi:hypothetical protein